MDGDPSLNIRAQVGLCVCMFSFFSHKSPYWSLETLSRGHTVHERESEALSNRYEQHDMGCWISHAQCPEYTDTTREIMGERQSGSDPTCYRLRNCITLSTA